MTGASLYYFSMKSETTPSPPESSLTSELIDLVREKSLTRGTFTLASGKTASYYLDAKQVLLDAHGSMIVGKAILERLTHHSCLPQAVGGMSIGADPVTSAVVTMAGVAEIPIKGFMVRKEAKGHGMQRYVEGPVEKGQHVVVLEDVITTGGSSLLAIERIHEFGLVVDRVITVIDRLAGAEQTLAAQGIPLESLVTIQDLGLSPE